MTAAFVAAHAAHPLAYAAVIAAALVVGLVSISHPRLIATTLNIALAALISAGAFAVWRLV